MRGVIRVEVRSWTVMARGGSAVCRRCARGPSGGPEYGPGPVSQHRCDNAHRQGFAKKYAYARIQIVGPAVYLVYRLLRT
jgi:hypothetical protein